MKKIFSMLLALTLLFSVTTAVCAKTFKDTEGTDCEEAVNILSAIGVLEGKSEDEFAPEDNLTRAEMTAIILRLNGLSSVGQGEKIFEDVPASHWAYNHISHAYKMGIVNGMGNGRFYPDNPVTGQEAVKMIVAALGYSVAAEAEGGFPVGYLTRAHKLGIIEEGKEYGINPVSRADMAILAYNALDVPMFEKASYGTDTGEYKETDKTFLDYLNVEYLEGQITSTYLGTFGDRLCDSENEIMIGSVIFSSEENYSDFLGRNVSIYYSYDEDKYTNNIIALTDETRNTLTITASDISNDTTDNLLVYEQNGKKLKENIAGAQLVLNGEIVPKTAENLSIVSGTLTLIANKSAAWDVIIAESYTNYIVNSVSVDKNTIYFKGGQGELDISSDNRNILFYDAEDPMELTILDLIEWDVVSVSKNSTGTAMRVIRSVRYIEGTVEEISDDKVTIDSVEYEISPFIALQGLDMPKLGKNAVYYLDFMGNIAAVNLNGVSLYKYGYLVDGYAGDGISPNPQLKVFTADGEMVVFDLANKVNLDGTYTDKEDVLALGSPLIGGSGVIRQLIRYETQKGLLSKIETAQDYKKDFDNPARLDTFSEDYYINETRTDADAYWAVFFVGGDRRSFAGKYLMREKSKIFMIPAAGSDDSLYKVKDQGTLTHGDDGDKYTKVTLYDVDEDYVVGAMVWDTGSGIPEYPTNSNNTAVVTRISEGLDPDGAPATIISIFTSLGEEKKLYAESTFECLMGVVNTNLETDPYAPAILTNKRDMEAKMPVSGIDVGDVIRYNTVMGTDEVSMITLISRANYRSGVEVLTNGNNLYPTTNEIVYRGGSLAGDGVIVRNSAHGYVVDVGLCYVWNDYTGRPTGATATRIYPHTGQLIEIDLTKNTYKKLDSDELSAGDEITSIWGGLAQQFIIRYKR